MRIADIHSLPLMIDLEVTIVLARVVLNRCVDDLEWHAASKKRLKLQLSSFDVYVIERIYPQASLSLETKLLATIDDILKKAELPFLISPIMRGDMNRLVFYARVEDLRPKRQYR